MRKGDSKVFDTYTILRNENHLFINHLLREINKRCFHDWDAHQRLDSVKMGSSQTYECTEKPVVRTRWIAW